MASAYESVFRKGLFEGETHLVTGGGTGIGRCIAHELASLGAHVCLGGRRREPLDETVGEIEEAGGSAEAWPVDIRDPDRVDETFRGIVDAHGPLHGLVNNAGGQFASPASQIRSRGWQAVIDTNLNGTWYACQTAFKRSMNRHGGRIVSIVADMWNGFPAMAHTGAARAGVVNLTRTLAVEWASAGVRINAVAPGYILSSGLRNYPKTIQQMAARVMPKNPSARLGTESEVAAAVTFLLTPAAAYINGATLPVDGGASLSKEPFVPLTQHEELPPWNGFHLAADTPPAFRSDSGEEEGGPKRQE